MTGIDLFREMDAIFSGSGMSRLLEASLSPLPAGRSSLRVNLREDAGNIYVEALLPGVEPKGLEMTVHKGRLTIAGERKGTEVEEGTWHRRERATGRFEHSIDIEAEIDVEQVRADCKDGILTVTLPKAASERPRRIAIQAA